LAIRMQKTLFEDESKTNTAGSINSKVRQPV
jgi:hypothetical protein